MKKLTLLLLFVLLASVSSAHPWKPNHYVIIDTDGGLDDMRSICMFLASPDVRVLGITVSPGALSAEDAYIKVKSLLNSFYHEGIPVGINRTKIFNSPGFPAAKSFIWGNENGIDPAKAPEFIKVIRQILSAEKTKISFISLGGMSSAYESLTNIPEFKIQVKQIVWSCNGLNDKNGFNYKIDKASASEILKQNIPVKAVISRDDLDFFDKGFNDLLGRINTRYANKVMDLSASSSGKDHSFALKANDEMVPVFIHFPELFTNNVTDNNTESIPSNQAGIREAFIKILKGETVAKNQVIREFPMNPEFYFEDIQPSVKEITEKHGEDEWIAGVLANELHRHLGVFAIIGVKMGIRAREYFDTGVDEFKVTSYAGSIPPLSCMNDGVQVSTGATPGHGLLTVRSDTASMPSCEFTYLNHRIRLTLQPGIAKKISEELKEINFIYGLDSNIYWELVRKNSIKYWRDLDRHEIFEIEVIN